MEPIISIRMIPGRGRAGDNSLGTKFTKGDIPLDTRNPDDIELMTQTTWNTAIVCVDELVDIGNNEISANLQMPYGAIAQQPSWNNYYKTSGDQMVYNVFEWLDEPGEFYFDKTEKTLVLLSQRRGKPRKR